MKILLPNEIEFQGSCKGITATQVERTATTALYKRTDGYFECFRIQVTQNYEFSNGSWIVTSDTIERYPSDEKFGVTAWSGREKMIQAIYNEMNAVSDVYMGDILPRSLENNTLAPVEEEDVEIACYE